MAKRDEGERDEGTRNNNREGKREADKRKEREWKTIRHMNGNMEETKTNTHGRENPNGKKTYEGEKRKLA